MSFRLYESIFANVDSALNSYIVDTVGNIINFATPLFTSMLIVWIALWGYLMMVGRVQEPLQEGVFRIIRIGGIITLGLTVGTYMSVVVNFLQQGPEHIAAVVSGTSGSAAETLDALFLKIFTIAKAAWVNAGLWNGNLGCYFIAGFILVIGGGLTLFVAFLTLLSKIMTTILLGVGPLFIIMLLFPVTRRFFESWLGLIANYGILLVLSTSIGNLMISLAGLFIDKMAPTESVLANLANLGPAVVLDLVFALCILVVSQIPSTAAALGGGIALSTRGAFGSAISALRPTKLRREGRKIKHDMQLGANATGVPWAAKKTTAAYQKRFGGNSMTGS